ncbi:hypothetical protein JCM9533A_70780 [Catenuloplanes niger JCM 9533]
MRLAVPAVRLAVPAVRLAVPAVRLAVPAVRLAVPAVRLAVPAVRPAVPAVRPAAPVVLPAAPVARGSRGAAPAAWPRGLFPAAHLTCREERRRRPVPAGALGTRPRRKREEMLCDPDFPAAHPARTATDAGAEVPWGYRGRWLAMTVTRSAAA